MSTMREARWVCWGLMSFMFCAPTFAQGTLFNPTEPLDQAVRLQISFGGYEVSVTTAMPSFSVEGHETETSKNRREGIQSNTHVLVHGYVQDENDDGLWLVSINGEFEAYESSKGMIGDPSPGKVPPHQEDIETESSLNVKASTLIRPGKRQRIVSQGDREVWLTLELVSED